MKALNRRDAGDARWSVGFKGPESKAVAGKWKQTFINIQHNNRSIRTYFSFLFFHPDPGTSDRASGTRAL